jgi:hypothetical protein
MPEARPRQDSERVARGSDGASLAVCALEQPGRYGADSGGVWRCGMVVG